MIAAIIGLASTALLALAGVLAVVVWVYRLTRRPPPDPAPAAVSSQPPSTQGTP